MIAPNRWWISWASGMFAARSWQPLIHLNRSFCLLRDSIDGDPCHQFSPCNLEGEHRLCSPRCKTPARLATSASLANFSCSAFGYDVWLNSAEDPSLSFHVAKGWTKGLIVNPIGKSLFISRWSSIELFHSCSCLFCPVSSLLSTRRETLQLLTRFRVPGHFGCLCLRLLFCCVLHGYNEFHLLHSELNW